MQFLEEPLQDTADLASFYAATHLPLALDESLDAAVQGLQVADENVVSAHLAQLLAPGNGVAALVVKPGVVGGVHEALSLAHWGHAAGCKVRLPLCMAVLPLAMSCT